MVDGMVRSWNGGWWMEWSGWGVVQRVEWWMVDEMVKLGNGALVRSWNGAEGGMVEWWMVDGMVRLWTGGAETC